MKHGHRIRKTEMIARDDQGTLIRDVLFTNQFKIREGVQGRADQILKSGSDQ